MSKTERQKEYDRRYYLKHREQKNERVKAYYHKNLEKCRTYQNQRNKTLTEKLHGLIGDTCFICSSKEHIIFHEKHGLNHERYRGANGYRYYLEHHKDFIPLCYLCHKLVHGLKRNIDKTKLEYVVSLLP